MTKPAAQSRTGAVVLVTYRPNAELFRVQLASIRDQTLSDFICIISEDGDLARTRRLVDEIVGDDDRFRVVGHEDNLGVYRNVERALTEVPRDVAWVALSDQDDRWYPDKLEHLIPQLADAMLAMNQARVTGWPSGEVLVPETDRKVLPVDLLVLSNQVTGSFAAFRRELLDLALPFPRQNSYMTFHDHWLGVCAAASGGYTVLPRVLQDYVQHGGNVVGELLVEVRGSRRRRLWRRAVASVAGARHLAERFEGGRSPSAVLRMHANGAFGWRHAMLEALRERSCSLLIDSIAFDFDPASGASGVLRLVRRARTTPGLAHGAAESLIAGAPYEIWRRCRPRGAVRHG